MADLLVHSGSYNADTGLPILEKWHDNGDGSYSRTLTTAGGSGGGAVTVADGADVALGQKSDATTDFGGPASLIALAAAIWKRLRGGQATKANSMPVALASDSDALPVTGTFWQATQPVSGTVTALIPADQPITVADLAVSVKAILDLLANPISQDPASGRQRVTIENIAAALTLATVTTVGTVSQVTSMAQIGSVGAQSTVLDMMHMMWADSVRPRIT